MAKKDDKIVEDLLATIREKLASQRIVDCVDDFMHLTNCNDLFPSEVVTREEIETFSEIVGGLEETAVSFASEVSGDRFPKKNVSDILMADILRIQMIVNDIDVRHRCLKPVGAYGVLRSKAEKITDISAIKPTLEKFVSHEAMLFLNDSQTEQEKLETKHKLYEDWDQYRDEVFSYIASSSSWKEDSYDVFLDIVLSPTVDSITSQLLVSAVTLSCITVFDTLKMSFLHQVYVASDDEEVKQRALIGYLLSLVRQPNDISGISFASCLLEDIKEDPFAIKDIVNVQKLLALAMGSEESSHRFSKKLFDDMSSSLLGSIKRHVSENIDDDLKDIFAMDDDEEEDDSLDEGNGEQVMDLFDNGVDMLLPQFGIMFKKSDFFDSVSNWFMPYYDDNPLITRAASKNKNLDVATMCSRTAYSSPADAYALAGMLFKDPDSMPAEVKGQFMAQRLEEMNASENEEDDEDAENADIDDETSVDESSVDETSADETTEQGNSENAIKQIRISYIHALYRFFKYCVWRQDFFNVFDAKEEHPGFAVLNSMALKTPLFDKSRLSLARFSLRKEIPEMVCQMLKGRENEESLEVQYMLGWAYLQSSEPDKLWQAEKHIKHLLEMQPGMKKAYLMLETCYNELKERKLYLENFEKIWQFSDSLSEEQKLDLKRSKLMMLFEGGQLDETIKLAYELEYNHPELERVAAILTYCLIKRGDDSQGDWEKVQDRLDTYFAEENKIMDKMKEQGSQDMETAFTTAMGVFLKMMEKDSEAEALNDYSHGLLFLKQGDYHNATDSFLRCFTFWRKTSPDKFYNYLMSDRELLGKLGYQEDAVILMYNYVQIMFLDTMRKVGKYGGKQQK